MPVNSKARIEWIDTAKGIGIILVMFGHCYLDDRFVFWFDSFHLPLFFSLSGYTFSGEGNYFLYFKKKVRTLLIPYIFLAILTMIWNAGLAITHGNTYEFKEIIYLYVIQKRYTVLWFITTLFIADQIMYGVNKLCKRTFYWIICGITALLFFWIYRAIIGVDLPWNIDLSVLAIAYMCLGKYIRLARLDSLRQTKVSIFIVILGAASLITSYCNFYFFEVPDWYADVFGNPVLYILSSVLGILVVCAVSRKLPHTGLVYLGQNSMLFYGLHRLIIDIIYVIYNKVGWNISSGSAVSLLAAIISVIGAIIILLPVNIICLHCFPYGLGKHRK